MSFYANKRVFLSGGSKGIGQEAAKQLARAGASVTIAARGQKALDETLAILNDLGPSGKHLAVSVDITNAEAVQQAMDQAATAMGGLDVLICNAGYASTGSVIDAPPEQFQELLNVNYLGHIHLVRAAVPHLEKSGGHVSLVSSMLGFMSVWGYGAYSGSKFAIAGLAEALRQELLLKNINVSVFYPPTTTTPGLEVENEDKHPIIWAIESENSFTKTYAPEAVAKGLLRSIEKGRFENCIGWDSWLVFYARRVFPGIFRYLSDDELRKAVKKAGVDS